jgi:DNA-binding transcriptional ArsR family regulator
MLRCQKRRMSNLDIAFEACRCSSAVVTDRADAKPSRAAPQPEPVRPAIPAARRAAAISVLRHLRRLDEVVGVRHSGIARDVGLLLYEHAERGLSVNQISARTGFSGPTVRLVLDRLMEAKVVAAGVRQGKTQLYRLTAFGLAGFDGYVLALCGFAEAVSARTETCAAPEPSATTAPITPASTLAAAQAPGPDPAGGHQPPRVQYAGARPGRATEA